MAKVSAEDVAAKRLNSLAGDLEKLNASGEALSITLGRMFNARGFIQGLTLASVGIDEFIAKIEGMPGIGGDLLRGAVFGATGGAVKLDQRDRLKNWPTQRELDDWSQGSANVEEGFTRARKAAAAAGEATRRALAIEQATEAGKRMEEVVAKRIGDLNRENLETKAQQASLQAGLVPLAERHAEAELKLLQLSEKRTAIMLEGESIAARIAASSSANALEDMDFEERRLRLKIKADALGGRGVSGADIGALTAMAFARPGLELGALEGGRGVTLADRAARALADKVGLAGIPTRAAQAGTDLDIASRNREIGRLQSQIDLARLSKAPELAALEAKMRLLQDQNFVVAQTKADAEGKSGPVVFNVTISSTGEINYDEVFSRMYAGVIQGLTEVQHRTFAPQPPVHLPGSRGAGPF
jgi:hypothetical protein